MKKYCWVVMVGLTLLGCESGDEYHIQYIKEVTGDTDVAEDEGLNSSDNELPEGALSLSDVSVEEFKGTWVHYSKESAFYKNLGEVVPSGYTAQYLYLSTAGETIVKWACIDSPDSLPSTWIKTKSHLYDNVSLSFSDEIINVDGYHYFDDGRLERSYEYEDPFDSNVVKMYTDILVKVSDERLSGFGRASIEDESNLLPEVAAVCPLVDISEYNNRYAISVAMRFDNLESAWMTINFRSRGGTGEFTYAKPIDSNLPVMWQDFGASFSFNSSVLSEVFSTGSSSVLSATALIDENSDSDFSGDVELTFENDLQLNLTVALSLPPLLE